jgi:hypothetical protein
VSNYFYDILCHTIAFFIFKIIRIAPSKSDTFADNGTFGIADTISFPPADSDPQTVTTACGIDFFQFLRSKFLLIFLFKLSEFTGCEIKAFSGCEFNSHSRRFFRFSNILASSNFFQLFGSGFIIHQKFVKLLYIFFTHIVFPFMHIVVSTMKTQQNKKGYSKIEKL